MRAAERRKPCGGVSMQVEEDGQVGVSEERLERVCTFRFGNAGHTLLEFSTRFGQQMPRHVIANTSMELGKVSSQRNSESPVF